MIAAQRQLEGVKQITKSKQEKLPGTLCWIKPIFSVQLHQIKLHASQGPNTWFSLPKFKPSWEKQNSTDHATPLDGEANFD